MSPAPLQRILLVEDDDDIRTVTRLALESLGGFSVHACASGPEALRDGREFAPQLVILDVMMPDMDGPSTLEALRATSGLQDVPVVFLTAKVQAPEIARYRDLGAADVIAKPFDPMTLCQKVAAIWARVGGEPKERR